MARTAEEYDKLCRLLKPGDLIRTNINDGAVTSNEYLGTFVGVRNPLAWNIDLSCGLGSRDLHSIAPAWAIRDCGAKPEDVKFEVVSLVELQNVTGTLHDTIMKNREATQLIEELANLPA